MTKRSRFYQIGFFTLAIAFIGLCLFVGITAVQKSMKLNLGFQVNPSFECKIVYNGNTIFCNTTKNGESLIVGNGVSLNGNNLTLNQNFSGLGAEFTLTIHNYTALKTEISVSGTGANGDTLTLDAYSSGTAPYGNITITAIGTSATLTFAEFVPPTSWEEDGYTIRTYGTTGAVGKNRAYYSSTLHYKYYIEMGEYPQTGADSTTEDYLDSNYASLSTDANGYYTYNGEKYARVERPNTSYSVNSNTNFYKVEPIRWIVVGGLTDTAYDSDPATSATPFNPEKDVTYNSTDKTFTYDGTTYQNALLIAEQALINTRYDYGDGSEYSSSNTDGFTSNQPWQDTDIYNFLNTGETSLLNKIFTQTQKAKILGTTLYTGRKSAGGTGGSPTGTEGTSENNKLFLLADGNASGYDSDYTKENYKVEDYFNDPIARYGGTEEPNVTEYARASGAYWYSDYKSSYWWLRSGYYSSNRSACNVRNGGNLLNGYVDYGNGVRPSFVLNLA